MWTSGVRCEEVRVLIHSSQRLKSNSTLHVYPIHNNTRGVEVALRVKKKNELMLLRSGLESITLSGVETESKRLIAHTIGVVINSAIVYYFTFRTFREVCLLYSSFYFTFFSGYYKFIIIILYYIYI